MDDVIIIEDESTSFKPRRKKPSSFQMLQKVDKKMQLKKANKVANQQVQSSNTEAQNSNPDTQNSSNQVESSKVSDGKTFEIDLTTEDNESQSKVSAGVEMNPPSNEVEMTSVQSTSEVGQEAIKSMTASPAKIKLKKKLSGAQRKKLKREKRMAAGTWINYNKRKDSKKGRASVSPPKESKKRRASVSPPKVSKNRYSSVSPTRDSYNHSVSSNSRNNNEERWTNRSPEFVTVEDDDADIPDRSFGDLYCKFCDSHMNSEGMWEAHIQGKRHKKHVKKTDSSDHKYVILDDEAIFQAEAKDSRELIIGLEHCCEIRKADGKPTYQCFLCSANLPNACQMMEHLIGLKHKMTYLKDKDPGRHDLINKADLKKGMIEPVVEEAIQLHSDKFGMGKMQVRSVKSKPKTWPSPKKPAPEPHSSSFYDKVDAKYGQVRPRMSSYSKDKMDIIFGDNDSRSLSPRHRDDFRSLSPRHRDDFRSLSPRRPGDYRSLSPRRASPDMGYSDSRSRRWYNDDLYSDSKYEHSRYKDDLYRSGRDNHRPRERSMTPPFPRAIFSSSSIDAKHDRKGSSWIPLDVPPSPNTSDLRAFLDRRKNQDIRSQNIGRALPTPSDNPSSNLLESVLTFLDTMPSTSFLQLMFARVERMNPNKEELILFEKIGNYMMSCVVDKKVKNLPPELLSKYQQILGTSTTINAPVPPPQPIPPPQPVPPPAATGPSALLTNYPVSVASSVAPTHPPVETGPMLARNNPNLGGLLEHPPVETGPPMLSRNNPNRGGLLDPPPLETGPMLSRNNPNLGGLLDHPPVEPGPMLTRNNSNLSGLMDLVSYYKSANSSNVQPTYRQTPYQNSPNHSAPGSEPPFLSRPPPTFANSKIGYPTPSDNVSIRGMVPFQNDRNQSFGRQNQADFNATRYPWNNPYNRYKM